VINSTRLGTLSLVLRSIADYQQTADTERKNSVNRPIRMIRFGRGQEVSAATEAEVTDASYGNSEAQPTGE
jgi:Flp pilus assembly protein CpaB